MDWSKLHQKTLTKKLSTLDGTPLQKKKKELLFLAVSSYPVSNSYFEFVDTFYKPLFIKTMIEEAQPVVMAKNDFEYREKNVFDRNFWSVWNQESDVENRIDDC